MRFNAILKMLIVLQAMILIAASAEATTVGFDPTDQTVFRGESARADLEIFDLDGEVVSAYDLDILYDSTVVRATGVVFTNALGDELFFEVLSSSATSTPGVVDLAEVSLLSDADLFSQQGGDSVRVASLIFDAVGVGETYLDVVFDETNDIKGRLGQILDADSTRGRIEVLGPVAAVPEPSSALVFCVGIALVSRFFGRDRSR